MNQAELAQIIDHQIFAAESAAIRKRVLMRVCERQKRRDQKAREWMPRGLGAMRFNAMPEMPKAKPEPKPKFKPKIIKAKPKASERKTPGPKAVVVSRDGKSLTIKGWAEHLGITIGTMRSRISRLGSIEAAIDAGPICPAIRTGGYSQTSHPSLGTGVGRHETDFEGNGDEL